YCLGETVSVAAYRNMIGDGSALAQLGAPPSAPSTLSLLLAGANATAAASSSEASLLSLSVLAANPAVVCHEGAHRAYYGWACLLAVAYVVALPLCSVAWVAHTLTRFLRGALGWQGWFDAAAAARRQQREWRDASASRAVYAARTAAVWLCCASGARR